MKFISFLLTFVILKAGIISFSVACHREDCPHSGTDTGVHWQRSLRFSYHDQEFNLLKNHQALSRRAEEQEREERIEFLNIALGNVQFVYEEEGVFKTTPPFEIRALDENSVPNPFFSNLTTDQPTAYSYVKFPREGLVGQRYKMANNFLSQVTQIPLALYWERMEELNSSKAQIIEKIKKKIRKKRRRHYGGAAYQMYEEFLSNVEMAGISAAERIFSDMQAACPLEENISREIHTYFQQYKELKRSVKEDIQKYLKTPKCRVFANNLFGAEGWQRKMRTLERRHTAHTYIQLVQDLVEEGERLRQEEEQALYMTPVNAAWRRLQTPERDFRQHSYLPFKRAKMLEDLEAGVKESHLQHSEQLFLYYVNTHFPQIAEQLSTFLERKKIGHVSLQGAFLNLFSTRDMCERCAVCLTIDHTHKEGLASHLRKFIRKHNKIVGKPKGKPFVVYAVSSRVPYGTPIKTEKINSREGLKSVDAYSDREKGRNVETLSAAHISIQTALYAIPTTDEGEFTEDQLIEINTNLAPEDPMEE